MDHAPVPGEQSSGHIYLVTNSPGCQLGTPSLTDHVISLKKKKFLCFHVYLQAEDCDTSERDWALEANGPGFKSPLGPFPTVRLLGAPESLY